MTAASRLGQAVDGILQRLTALQMLAVPDCKNAVPHPFHVQDTWPYWLNWYDGVTPHVQGDRTVTAHTLAVEMRLVLGHVSSVHEATFQYDSLLAAVDVAAYFERCPHLADSQADDAALHTPPCWMGPSGIILEPGGLTFGDSITPSVMLLYVRYDIRVPITIGA